MRVVPVKAVSVAVAAASCVLFTSLLSRAAEEKRNASYLLTIRIPNDITQEIQVSAHDEFKVSTATGDKQHVFEGTTDLVGEKMRVKLQLKSTDIKEVAVPYLKIEDSELGHDIDVAVPVYAPDAPIGGTVISGSTVTPGTNNQPARVVSLMVNVSVRKSSVTAR
jgi:hypothetical protein